MSIHAPRGDVIHDVNWAALSNTASAHSLSDSVTHDHDGSLTRQLTVIV